MTSSVEVPRYLDALGGPRVTIPCPLCQSDDHELVYEGIALRGNDLTCVCCRGCGHLFLNPRPPMDAFKDFYLGDSYFHLCAEFSGVALDAKLAQFDSEDYWTARFAYGQRLHEKYFQGELVASDVVFDFGCGDGAWVWALQELCGCEIDGQEISDVYANIVRRKVGIDIFVGAVEECGAAIADKHGASVKVAIVSGSLQHMLDPMYCLAIAREILRGDGYLFVCNWNLFDHYMAPYAGDPEGFYGATRRVLGEVLSWEHPHYFHAASFRYMVESAGFEILDFEFDSQIRPRHMGVLARPAVEVVASRPAMAAVDVIARLRALESAAVAARVSERLQPSEKRQK